MGVVHWDAFAVVVAQRGFLDGGVIARWTTCQRSAACSHGRTVSGPNKQILSRKFTRGLGHLVGFGACRT